MLKVIILALNSTCKSTIINIYDKCFHAAYFFFWSTWNFHIKVNYLQHHASAGIVMTVVPACPHTPLVKGNLWFPQMTWLRTHVNPINAYIALWTPLGLPDNKPHCGLRGFIRTYINKPITFAGVIWTLTVRASKVRLKVLGDNDMSVRQGRRTGRPTADHSRRPCRGRV